MQLKITVLEGDGIGPEVTREAVGVLRTVAGIYGHRFEFEERLIGGAAIRQHDSPLPTVTLDACLASDAVLLGAVGAPEFDALPAHQRPEAGLLLLRQALGDYANLRPAISYDVISAASPLRPEIASGADILIVRELLGGLYFGEPRGFRGDNGNSAAVNTMRYSVAEVERVARVAFAAASKRRRKVTSVDKANVLETSQLWRQTVSRVARDYPEVTLDHLYVDACAMHLITNPKRFDVILTENLFGDILSDEAAVITGSLGMLGVGEHWRRSGIIRAGARFGARHRRPRDCESLWRDCFGGAVAALHWRARAGSRNRGRSDSLSAQSRLSHSGHQRRQRRIPGQHF